MLVAQSCSDESKFVQFTDEQIWGNWDALSQLQTRVNKTRFAEQQTLLGLTFSEHGVLGNKGLRTFLRPTEHIFFGPAHVILSNGIFTWSIYDFLEKLFELSETRVTWESFRKFVSDIEWVIPTPQAGFMSKSGREQLVSSERAKASRSNFQYKGSIGDQLALMRILRYYCELMESKVGGLQSAAKAYKLACDVVEAFFFPMCVVPAGDPDLQRLLQDCFDAYFEAYPGTPKPKWHQLMHLARFRLPQNGTLK